MNEYSIDFSQMGNWKPEGIQTVPAWTLGQEGLDKAISSLGDVLGVYTRKDAISKDPELESLKEQLEALVSRKSKLQNEIANINASIYDEEDKGMLADRAYEQAANLDPKARATKQMEGYRPSDSSTETEQMEGYKPNMNAYKGYNIFG